MKQLPSDFDATLRPGRFAAACAYLGAGFSVFRLSPGSKLPATKWRNSQVTRPTTPLLESWFAKTENNVGLVLGSVSGNALALDFDDRDLARFAFDLGRLAQETFVQETPRGYHVLLRTPRGPMATTTHRSHGIPLDLKGEGGYIVAAPSALLHGGTYKSLSPGLRVAAVDAREVGAFIAWLESEWPGARAARRRCDRGVQGVFEDFEARDARPSVLKLASNPTRRSVQK